VCAQVVLLTIYVGFAGGGWMATSVLLLAVFLGVVQFKISEISRSNTTDMMSFAENGIPQTKSELLSGLFLVFMYYIQTSQVVMARLIMKSLLWVPSRIHFVNFALTGQRCELALRPFFTSHFYRLLMAMAAPAVLFVICAVLLLLRVVVWRCWKICKCGCAQMRNRRAESDEVCFLFTS